MEMKTYVALDGNGKVLSGAKAYIYMQGTEVLASNFTDANGVTLANPSTVGSDGVVSFKGPTGAYDLQFEANEKKGPKFAFQLLDQQILFDANVVNGVEGFNALRQRAVKKDGERVYLKYHTLRKDNYAQTNFCGAGWFVGYKTAKADDGGVIASNGGAYHWRREYDNIGMLTVDDFGGCPDGVILGDNSKRTDNAPAIRAMYNFMNSSEQVASSGDNSRRQGVKFNAGIYYTTPLDFSNEDNGNTSAEFLLMSVVHVFSGQHCATTIISDKSDGFVFTVRHRRVTIHGINWNGQQTTKQDPYNSSVNPPTGTNMLVGATMGVFNDTASNKQGFFKNLGAGGQITTVDCFKANNTGGVIFSFLDTLDTITNQIFCFAYAAPVAVFGWSGQAVGVWDHSTAWKLHKANFQYGCAPTFVAQRVTQGVWDDVWFEHGVCQFDISQCQIEMRAVSVESSKGNPHTYRSRVIMTQYSAPGPTYNWPDFDTVPGSPNWLAYPTNPDGSAFTNWQSDGEQGYIHMDSAFSRFNSPVSILWSPGALVLRNPGGSNNWFKVGRFHMSTQGSQFRVKIEGTNGYNVLKGTDARLEDNEAPANAVIYIQSRGSGAYKSTLEYNNGESCVLDTRLQPVSNSNDVDLYVQISGYVGGASVHVEGTGKTRYESGDPDLFVKSGELQTVVPSGTQIPEESWWGKGAGFGIHRNKVYIKTANSTNADKIYTAKPAQFISINLNGSDLDMPWYARIPEFTSISNSTSVATGGTLTLNGVATNVSKYQWFKDGSPIAGATNSTYTKNNVTSADAGVYKLQAIGLPAENISNSPDINVTVTS